MKLLIFRHGQAEHNVTRTFDSSLDSKAHLTPLGIENLLVNVRAVKDLCKKEHIGFGAMYSSPLLRTVETSLLIHREFEMPNTMQIRLDLRLRELMMGDWDKKLSTHYPGKNWDFSRNPEWGGESEQDVINRVRSFISSLAYANYIVVSHGDIIRKMVNSIFPKEDYIPLQGSGIFIDVDTKEKLIYNQSY